MLTLFGILLRTMLGTFGGINDQAINPMQSGFHLIRGPQLSIGHQLSMHQGIV